MSLSTCLMPKICPTHQCHNGLWPFTHWFMRLGKEATCVPVLRALRCYATLPEDLAQMPMHLLCRADIWSPAPTLCTLNFGHVANIHLFRSGNLDSSWKDNDGSCGYVIRAANNIRGDGVPDRDDYARVSLYLENIVDSLTTELCGAIQCYRAVVACIKENCHQLDSEGYVTTTYCGCNTNPMPLLVDRVTKCRRIRWLLDWSDRLELVLRQLQCCRCHIEFLADGLQDLYG